MTIASRVKQMRQEKQWTQAELAEKMGIKQKQISAYEREINSPSADVLIKFAEVFDVTIDYLAFATRGQKAKLNIQDRKLLRRFEQLDTMTEKEKGLAKEILDLIILQHKFKELVSPGTAA